MYKLIPQSPCFKCLKTTPFVYSFFYRTEYKRRSWTLNKQCYTDIKYDSEFYCGKYLKKNYGGGGHVGAAGCKVTEEQFIEMLKSRTI